jgi:hypothetical protein
VMRLFERADPARVDDDTAPAADGVGYLATLHRRSSNVTLIDTEPTSTGSGPRHRRRHIAVAAAAIVAIVAGAILLAGRSDPSGPQIPAATTAASETPASAAEQVARRFIDARNAWDAETVRSLLADDAVIDESFVTDVADYPARVQMERIRGWNFLQPQCTTTEVGPPAHVTCTYTMEDALTRALGVGPFTGSSFEFVIADERIEEVRHDFDFSQYSPQAFEVMWDWLDETHPGDTDVMWVTDAQGYASPILTPEALALLAQRIPEFELVAPAMSFVEARDSWDGETVRSLVADDAVIDGDFTVAAADDYLVNADFERAFEWRFSQPKCTPTELGPPAEVTCTYVMQNALTRALDVGPLTGSRFEFVIEDGRIEEVRHTFDTSRYSVEAFEVFVGWLDETHPGDGDVIFDTALDGSMSRNTSPEALALLEQRIPEFVASQDDAQD